MTTWAEEAVRTAVGDGWFFAVDETYFLFELSVDSVILGLRGADEWPPRYSRWNAPDQATAG